ncbi:DUF2188 domain-containing protein [Domibacillus epiphyticus]|uniref:DUF2188 domain-containing protein n=1 Tax=Domibacillus epiphyticus TaxID=1714355 RepID=A0A1V2AAG4_9BACI|nr:hypothetical protein [Domibacillus epiphyticus]OMP67794.1 hypothetical protein BTO28_04720 [Domibacillus epiphyticus]
MPWSKNDYPDSMKNLSDPVREKTIEIANALLEDGYEEGRSIAIAIDRARSSAGKEESGRPHYEVKAKNERWGLMKKNGERNILSGETKKDVLTRAKEYVNNHEGVLTVYKENGEKEETLYE